jgi:hypothetical protein
MGKSKKPIETCLMRLADRQELIEMSGCHRVSAWRILKDAERHRLIPEDEIKRWRT